MASKGKQAEVNSARIRLDATLQHLVDRKEECHETSEGESSAPLTDSVSKPSPRKSASKTSRKRKRRDDTSDYENVDEQQTVIMKLFDRSVDLALFPEDTPLYPVCRAWLQNRPHDKTLGTLSERPSSPKLDEEQSLDFYPNVYEMPQAIKSEDGCLYDLRIPEPLPQPEDRLDLDADPKAILPCDQLLLNHMNRWKEVRNRWREASILHEMQYMGSINLLKEMFDRNL
ncbi:unnamed protein product [Lymnaea stagnalis]|uniref:Protein lin-37 homolog n=1 Tax=Lymnaea stagnalis TaxID=6523 RepID=A0AAV2IGH8_LYMST